MDSPGHCAKFCTYICMDQQTKQVLTLEVIDKRQTELKSGTMEARGFVLGMETLKTKGVNVVEVVTDAHPQVRSIMKKQHPDKKHSYDMWHGVKNFGKKLSNVAGERGNEDLKPWVKHILNHFWYSARMCDGDIDKLRSKWLSVLHHVVNSHLGVFTKCDHEELADDEARETKWLVEGEKAHLALRKLIFDDRFMQTLPYYVNCQSTSELESFNNHILMYAAKRQAFIYPVYKCRCQLAAIDYQKHLNRPLQLNKDGSQRYHRYFSKASNNWTVKAVKVNKIYSYIPELMAMAVNDYCVGHKDKPLRSAAVITIDDPRRISNTIAKRPPPASKDLIKTKVSRFLLPETETNVELKEPEVSSSIMEMEMFYDMDTASDEEQLITVVKTHKNSTVSL